MILRCLGDEKSEVLKPREIVEDIAWAGTQTEIWNMLTS
jgi:hypothetical protein